MCYNHLIMQTPKRKPIRILAHICAMQKASREMSGGILQYSATHPNVQIRLYGEGTPWQKLEEFKEWKPDGIIIGSTAPHTINGISRLGCQAAVFINIEPPQQIGIRHTSIYCDNRAVAEAAARLFQMKKLNHFAFVGSRFGDEWSIERGRHFQDLVHTDKTTFASFITATPKQTSHHSEISMLAEWLAALPKPCGVFAACDIRAKDVLDAASDSGLSIPEQMLVLGVDDEEFICRQTTPSLSSIIPDFSGGGYLAAQTLVKLIKREQKHSQLNYFGVKGIVERLSTGDANGSSRMVCRANEFIQNHAVSIRSVKEIAKASGASLRILQKNFKTITGRTIHNALTENRLQRVCTMLRHTVTPISQIGELCGFSNESHLKKIFRQHYGTTMSAYRSKVCAEAANTR
ncbi:MAG: helix-turn-helix domain-containing protein [Lentisphaerae bacterium]|nr:helix-turn-helix domain-containing protein [Lentisphaerota bacterium]